MVLRTSVAVAVPKESSERIEAAWLKWAAQDVAVLVVTFASGEITNRHEIYQPRMSANMSGATIVASDSTMNFGVFSESLPQVIFSLGTAPE